MVEVIGVLFIGRLTGKISTKFRAVVAIIIANLASFLLPYIIRAYSLKATSGENAWEDAFEGGPYYIVLFEYLFLTLVIEIPIVYSLLKKQTENNKRLLITIVVVNVVTTLAVAILERNLYYGHW